MMSESRAGLQTLGFGCGWGNSRLSHEMQSVCSTLILLSVEAAALAAVTGLAIAIRSMLGGACSDCSMPTQATSYIGAAVLTAGLLAQSGFAGRYDRRRPFWTDLQQACSTGLVLTLVLIGLGLLTGEMHLFVTPAIIVIGFPLAAGFAGLAVKRILPGIGLWTLPVLVIGEPAEAADLAAVLQADPALGYRVVCQVEPGAVAARIGSTSLRGLLDQSGARYLAIASIAQNEFRLAIIQAALREKVPFATVPAMPAFIYDVTRLFSHDTVLLSSRHGLARPLARLAKTVLDVLSASVLLAILSPLMLAVAVAIRLDGGPALFRHRRLGLGGKNFGCLKFRTMHTDADAILEAALLTDSALAEEWRRTRKLRNDPRVTRLGHFLRSTSMDELPQLLNVIRLEMSLVGPRPIVQAEAAFYGEEIAQYYAARPGLTGLWQVSGRSNTSFQQRVALDVRYVNTWTMALDALIVLRTIPAVLARTGAR